MRPGGLGNAGREDDAPPSRGAGPAVRVRFAFDQDGAAEAAHEKSDDAGPLDALAPGAKAETALELAAIQARLAAAKLGRGVEADEAALSATGGFATLSRVADDVAAELAQMGAVSALDQAAAGASAKLAWMGPLLGLAQARGDAEPQVPLALDTPAARQADDASPPVAGWMIEGAGVATAPRALSLADMMPSILLEDPHLREWALANCSCVADASADFAESRSRYEVLRWIDYPDMRRGMEAADFDRLRRQVAAAEAAIVWFDAREHRGLVWVGSERRSWLGDKWRRAAEDLRAFIDDPEAVLGPDPLRDLPDAAPEFLAASLGAGLDGGAAQRTAARLVDRKGEQYLRDEATSAEIAWRDSGAFVAEALRRVRDGAGRSWPDHEAVLDAAAARAREAGQAREWAERGAPLHNACFEAAKAAIVDALACGAILSFRPFGMPGRCALIPAAEWAAPAPDGIALGARHLDGLFFVFVEDLRRTGIVARAPDLEGLAERLEDAASAAAPRSRARVEVAEVIAGLPVGGRNLPFNIVRLQKPKREKPFGAEKGKRNEHKAPWIIAAVAHLFLKCKITQDEIEAKNIAAFEVQKEHPEKMKSFQSGRPAINNAFRRFKVDLDNGLYGFEPNNPR